MMYIKKSHKLNRYVAIKVLKPEYSEDKTFVSKSRLRHRLRQALCMPISLMYTM